MRIKLKLKKATCFAMGAAGAAMNILTGCLMAAGVGNAQYAHTASFVLLGAMLLLLGVMEKGEANKRRRVQLLFLFFVLLVAYLRLPLLDLVEIAVLPLLALLYPGKGGTPWVAVLALVEAAYAAVRTLALVPRFVGGRPLLAVGLGLITVGLARGALLLRLRAREAALPPDPSGETHRLR